MGSSSLAPHQDVTHHLVSLLSGLADPVRSSLFRFISVTVNDEIEQDDSHYTEYGHCIYPGKIGDHCLGRWGEEGWVGGEDGRRREGEHERRERGRRREGEQKRRERGSRREGKEEGGKRVQ